MREFYMTIERDEKGWYVGNVPELPGCHTQARTLDELKERMSEAIDLYLEDAEPTFPTSEFIGVQKVAVS